MNDREANVRGEKRKKNRNDVARATLTGLGGLIEYGRVCDYALLNDTKFLEGRDEANKKLFKSREKVTITDRITEKRLNNKETNVQPKKTQVTVKVENPKS